MRAAACVMMEEKVRSCRMLVLRISDHLSLFIFIDLQS